MCATLLSAYILDRSLAAPQVEIGDAKTVRMAGALLQQADAARAKLHGHARFVRTESDSRLLITELKFLLIAARLRGDASALREGLQRLRNAPGCTPCMLWSQALQLHGATAMDTALRQCIGAGTGCAAK